MRIVPSSDPMYLDAHACALGRLVGTFQSLELVIRTFLYSRRDPPHRGFRFRRSMSHLKAGNQVPDNAYTCFDTLGQLIGRFNRIVAKRFPANAIDPSVVMVRDALAHGRVWSDVAGPPLHLLKFSRPKGGVAQVKFAEVMSIDWLNAQTQRVHSEMMKVVPLLPKRAKNNRARRRAP